MARWQNWSGKLKANPQLLVFARSEAHLQQEIVSAYQQHRRIRTAGAGHSHSPLVISNEVIIDASGLSGVIEADKRAQSAWVWAGTPIYALGRPLHDRGLALNNQGDIDRQSIAGAVATGTHGTGPNLKNLSASVRALRLVLASGERVQCNSTQESELWQVARHHLGSLAFITQIELALRPAYRLAETTWREPLSGLLAKLKDLIPGHRHLEFFWYPATDEAQVKTTDETGLDAQYPLAAEGSRVAWSYEVLANHRPNKHTEMEYSVPASQGPSCMTAIQRLLQTEFKEVQWPVEYRTLCADDLWLSTANGRETVTISVHQDVREDETAYFKACEEIFLSFDGRPHWGKVNYLNASQLANRHNDWQSWWQVRDRYDPKQLFLNDYMLSIRP